jgi:excisionase family DNA binding protein
MIDQPFYDLPDVAMKLGNCSRSTLYRLIEQGKLVRVRLGSKALITGKSLAAYVDELSYPRSTHEPAQHSQKHPDTAGDMIR